MSGLLGAMMTGGSHGVAFSPDININQTSYGSAPNSGSLQGNSGLSLYFRRNGKIEIEPFGPFGDTVISGNKPNSWGFWQGDGGVTTSPLGSWYKIRGFTTSFYGDTSFAGVANFFNPPYYGNVPIVGQYTRWWFLSPNHVFGWSVTAPGKSFTHTGFFEFQSISDTGTVLATKVLPFAYTISSKP